MYLRLMVLEELLHATLLKVICHCVDPSEGHSTIGDLIYGLAGKLHINPSQVASHLHLFHLPFGLGIQIRQQIRELLVFCPLPVILQLSRKVSG